MTLSLNRSHPPAWKLTKILGLGKLGAWERKNTDPNQGNNVFLHHTDRFGEFYSKIESKMGQWWPRKLAHCYYRRLEIRWWSLADSGEKKWVGCQPLSATWPHKAPPNLSLTWRLQPASIWMQILTFDDLRTLKNPKLFMYCQKLILNWIGIKFEILKFKFEIRNFGKMRVVFICNLRVKLNEFRISK